ncbi:MAG: cytochrome c biogenesis protein CcdA [Vicinamibacterales bacterium]
MSAFGRALTARLRRTRTTYIALFAGTLAGVAGLHAQGGPARAEIAPFVETTPATGDVRIALRVTLPAGFHTNSNKPRDPSLIPLTLRFSGPLPPGVEVTEVVFPPPTDLKQEGAAQPLRVFDGEFVIGAVVRLAPSVTGAFDLAAQLRYQACDESACYLPVRLSTSWRLEAAQAAGPKAHQDVFRAIKFGTGEAASVVEAPTANTAAPVTAPVAPPVAVLSDRDALARWQEQGTTTGYQSAADFLTFVRNSESGVREKGLFDGRGPLAILLLVLVGGLMLNLTPCVLPMIPINLAIIGAGAQAGSRGRGFFLGLTYGAAMALVYGVLGLVVILTASTFGTINSYWWFNAGIAALFVVLALAMFDVIVIDFSRFSGHLRVEEKSRGSFVVAFAMGSVAALLAGACVAPVVIQVVLFASDRYAAGAPGALALPFLLGVGMAIPWPFAGAGLAALPRPGAWMVRIKQAFGAVILVTAAYYGYEAYRLVSDRWVNATAVASSVEEKLKEGWHASLAEGLATAEREGKPVLVDMWATWCKNCLVMDGTTLKNPDVISALSGYVKVKFQAEDPDDQNVAQVMQALNAKGLPTYVILKRR